jgi:DNA invertase Pin-like site-specific DNA recombinase
VVTVEAHDRLQAYGVALKSATEPIDTSNPSGRLIFQMLASFAEYERETIRERTRAGNSTTRQTTPESSKPAAKSSPSASAPSRPKRTVTSGPTPRDTSRRRS